MLCHCVKMASEITLTLTIQNEQNKSLFAQIRQNKKYHYEADSRGNPAPVRFRARKYSNALLQECKSYIAQASWATKHEIRINPLPSSTPE